MKSLAPFSSIMSSAGSAFSTNSMVYSIPTQPAFFTPTRTPATGLPEPAMICLMRSAAASESVNIFGLFDILPMRLQMAPRPLCVKMLFHA